MIKTDNQTTSKKDKTAAERNRRLREKQAREGLVLVQVKIPAICRDEILDIAIKMRDGEKKATGQAEPGTFLEN